jgi:hypothetical protein
MVIVLLNYFTATCLIFNAWSNLNEKLFACHYYTSSYKLNCQHNDFAKISISINAIPETGIYVITRNKVRIVVTLM